MRYPEVIVLDNNKLFLDYCHPATARKLIKGALVTIYSKEPLVLQIADPKIAVRLKKREITLTSLVFNQKEE